MKKRLIEKDYYEQDGRNFSMCKYRKNLKRIKSLISTNKKRRKSLGVNNHEEIDGYHGYHSLKKTSFFTLTQQKYSGELLLREIALFAGS